MLTTAALCLLSFWIPSQEPNTSWLERFQQGWSEYERGELDRAQASWSACLELAPSNATTAYHLACLAARRKHADEAFEWLGRAARWGYADVDVARWDEDLATLRADARFASCLQQMDTARDRAPDTKTLSSACRLESYFAGASGSISPDGTRFVLEACPALLFDIETGAILATLPTADGSVTTASAFSPDGRLIATSTWGAAVRLWDGWSGELLREFVGPSLTTRALQFSSDGRRLMATAGALQQAAIWSLDSGSLIFLVTKPADDLACLSSDGARALTAGNGDLDIWDTDSKRVISTERPDGRWTGGGFSADGTVAFAWSPDQHSALAFDARTGRRLERRAIGAPLGVCTTLGSSHCLAIAEGEGSLSLWDPLTHSTRTLPSSDSSQLFSLASSPDGKLLAEYSKSGVRVVSTEDGATLWNEGPASLMEYRSLAFAPDSSILLLTDWGSQSQLREARTGRILLRLPSYSSWPRFTGLPRDGRWGRVRCGPKILRLFETTGVQPALELEVTEDTCFAFAPDSAEIALVDSRGTVEIRACSSGGHLRSWSSGMPATSGNDRPSPEPNWSPDGRTLLIQAAEQPAVLFDAHSGERLATLGEGRVHGSIAAWSRDGTCLAFGSETSIAVFNSRSGARLGPDLVHAKRITCVDFDPLGERLLVGCADARAHVWDWRAAREVLCLSHADKDWDELLEVGQAEYSPDGKRIVTTTDSLWEVALWNAQDGSRMWAYDYGGGNEAPIEAHFDNESRRVYVSGPSTGRVISEVTTGQNLVEAGRFGMGRLGRCLPIADTPLYLVESAGGLSVFDSRGDTLRFQRIEQPGGSLLAAPSRYFAGDREVAASTRIILGARSESLADYAALLYDPKRVRAAAAGIALRPASLPTLPVLDLHGGGREVACNADALELELGCTSAAPALRYLVQSDGSEHAFTPRAGESTVRVRVEKPSAGNRRVLRARVLDANGLQSRPVRVCIVFTPGK
jgi:WD40 repeat protein